MIRKYEYFICVMIYVFLLIFLVGYIFVEIIFGEKYLFRKSLDRYKGNLFDRVVHYISWGIVLNILYVILWIFNKDLKEKILSMFNDSGKVGNVFSFLGKAEDIQIILFGISYFIVFIIMLFLLKGVFFILDKVNLKVEKYFKSKKNSNWIKIKKVFIKK